MMLMVVVATAPTEDKERAIEAAIERDEGNLIDTLKDQELKERMDPELEVRGPGEGTTPDWKQWLHDLIYNRKKQKCREIKAFPYFVENIEEEIEYCKEKGFWD